MDFQALNLATASMCAVNTHPGLAKRSRLILQSFYKRGPYVLFLLTILLIFPTLVLANPTVTTKVLRIQGKIGQQTLEQLRLKLDGFYNQDPFPAGLIVLLDSPGGDSYAAMQIGRMLRQHQAHVFVTRRCDSACVFILMGGIVRAANPASVGVHAGRLTLMTPDGNVIKEIDSSSNLKNAYQLTSFNSTLRQYLQEMGIRHGILDVMLAQPSNRLYKLSSEDLNRYLVNGINSLYLQQRLHTLIRQGYLSPVDAIKYTQRTLSVPTQCNTTVDQNQAFIRCYQSTLQGRSH